MFAAGVSVLAAVASLVGVMAAVSVVVVVAAGSSLVASVVPLAAGGDEEQATAEDGEEMEEGAREEGEEKEEEEGEASEERRRWLAEVDARVSARAGFRPMKAPLTSSQRQASRCDRFLYNVLISSICCLESRLSVVS